MNRFSASTISELNTRLDEELERFARQPLEAEYPYLIVDARYEKVREGGVIRSRAVLVAIGIDWEGRRRILGVELAGRESATSWREFLLGLKERGLRGVQLVISDDHEGLKRAIGQGRITRITGLEEFRRRFGPHVARIELLAPGTPRRDWRATFLSDGNVVVRHPDLDAALTMANAAATDITMFAGG